jgi:two-component system sensor histidine kinase KdpD
MESSDRPDPEELLSAIRLEEKKSSSGKLKIFIGMSAGVGKTYAMLKAAHQQMEEDRDLVIGCIDTHGREETEQLLEGLPIIPTKWIQYRDTVFEELDLEKILAKKPSLVLIDELAHTNVPGSRHPKRWQDVIEILDSGIDVYTTVNVQHIESRKDLIESIAGISIRETVPDVILDRASEIELIDVTPGHLLKRLSEGKVYTGDQSKIAAQNFFKEDKLTALREVALRLTAEKVDRDLDTMLTAQAWKPNEKLMVAIDHHTDSQFLIRSARRLAASLNSSWIAIYVDKGTPLDPREQMNLARNLDLARQLGAESITTRDISLTAALKRVSNQKKVTQMIIGRPSDAPWWHLKKPSYNKLIEECGDIDVHVIRHTVPGKREKRKIPFQLPVLKAVYPYLFMGAFFTLITLISLSISRFTDPESIGLLYLLSILLISPFTELGPIIFAALLSSLFWGLIFLPQIDLKFIQFSSIVFFTIYFLTAIILGVFVSKIRQNEKMMRIREEDTQMLYEITQVIASGRSREAILESIGLKLGKILHGSCELAIKGADGTLQYDERHPFMNDEKEYTVAIWAFEKGKPAGWSTDTLPSVNNLYLPLLGFKETVGVLAFRPERPFPLSFDETHLLQTVCKQLASYLERSLTEDKKRKTEYVQQSSRVQRAIIDSIASELVTYLDMVRNSMLQFKQSAPPHQYNQQAHNALNKIDNATATMTRVLHNILAMSDLNVDVLALQKTEHSLSELVQLSLTALNDPILASHITVKIPVNLSLATFDMPLMQMLLSHLLEMFVVYVNRGYDVVIEGKEIKRRLELSLQTAISPAVLATSNFIQPPLTSEEIYLGTSVAKTIAELHSGKLEIHQREGSNLEFIVYLPLPTSLIGRISKLSQQQNPKVPLPPGQ